VYSVLILSILFSTIPSYSRSLFRDEFGLLCLLLLTDFSFFNILALFFYVSSNELSRRSFLLTPNSLLDLFSSLRVSAITTDSFKSCFRVENRCSFSPDSLAWPIAEEDGLSYTVDSGIFADYFEYRCMTMTFEAVWGSSETCSFTTAKDSLS